MLFHNPCAFGTGPIVLNCDDGGFMNYDWSADVDLFNKVVFAAMDWAMGLDGNNLTLHALGSTVVGDGAIHVGDPTGAILILR